MAPRPFGKVRKLKSGRYRADFPRPGSINPNDRIAAPHTFRTKTEARAWLAQQQAAIVTGVWVSPEEQQRLKERQQENTLGAMVEKWWEASSPWAPSEMRAQRNRYENHIKPTFEYTPLAEINSRMVAKWLENLKTIPRQNQKPRQASPATRKKCFELMRRIMSEAVDRELIDSNPLIGRRYLQRMTQCQEGEADTERETQLWAPQEIKAMIDELPERVRTLFVLLAVCGLRAQEVRPLQLKDFDFEQRTLSITHTVTGMGKNLTFRDATKTKAGTRTIPLSNAVIQEVKGHCTRQGIVAQSQFLFPMQDRPNLPIPEDTIRQHAKRVCKRLGYDGYTNPHSLRHAAITHAQRLNGVILIDVKQYFGHARTSDVTERYTHSDMTQLRLIAEGLSDLILGTA